MRQRITLTLVSRLQPGETVWDSEVKGFGVRRQTDTPAYFVKTRIKGRQRWASIGRHGSPWTPETARREALRILAQASEGHDVVEERRIERRRVTLAELAEIFQAEHGPKLKPQTRYDYARVIGATILPALGKRKVDDLTKADVSRFHSGLADTPRKANLALAILAKMLSWGVDHGYADAERPSPCKGITKFRENARERYLTASEIARLFEVLDGLDATADETPYVTSAIRLLLLTGARLSEITTLRWDWVDLETGALWLPDSKTGKKTIRLNAQALAILRALPRETGNPHVIVGHRAGAALVNLQKPWRRIRELAGLDDVRIHDLRHSFASVAINAGASLPMVGKLLGHTQTRTTARYAHLADDPLRQLNEQIGAAMTAKAKPGTDAA